MVTAAGATSSAIAFGTTKPPTSANVTATRPMTVRLSIVTSCHLPLGC
jgi:hypothetical protein